MALDRVRVVTLPALPTQRALSSSTLFLAISMPTIDQYSVAAIPIEMYFNDTFLSIGTAFLWAQDDRLFLITNWHNVSGKDPNTGEHLSKTAAEPNRIKVWFNRKNQLGDKFAKFVPIRDTQGVPVWFVHPQHGN